MIFNIQIEINPIYNQRGMPVLENHKNELEKVVLDHITVLRKSHIIYGQFTYSIDDTVYECIWTFKN